MSQANPLLFNGSTALLHGATHQHFPLYSALIFSPHLWYCVAFSHALPTNSACAANFIHVYLGGPTVCCFLSVDVGTAELPGMNAATQQSGAGSSQ